MPNIHYMTKRHTSERIQLPPGATAVAPKVDDPQGFAVHSALPSPITVSFNYDPDAHIMTVLIEGKGAAERLPPELGGDHDGPLVGQA